MDAERRAYMDVLAARPDKSLHATRPPATNPSHGSICEVAYGLGICKTLLFGRDDNMRHRLFTPDGAELSRIQQIQFGYCMLLTRICSLTPSRGCAAR
jgi:hypothetical protein